MKFGIMFDTHIDKWELVRYAEELGYEPRRSKPSSRQRSLEGTAGANRSFATR